MVEDEAILEAAEKHRDDLQAAVKALIRAANKGGGEDNITVVLFEIAESEADERTLDTVDAGEPEPAREPDEEDTLSELDAVAAIQIEDRGDVAVGPEVEAEPLAVESESRVDAYLEPEREPSPAEPAEPTAGPLHKLLALLVILGLIALIAFLVLWGLAR